MIKVITTWQPWASLWACEAKMFETRGWETAYRGPIAIHAGLKWVGFYPQIFSQAAHEALSLALPGFKCMHALPRGAIIATGDLVNCYPIIAPARIEGMVSTGKILTPDGPVSIYGNEYLFGDWTPGRFAWEVTNRKLLDTPIPVQGKQGLWNWDGAL